MATTLRKDAKNELIRILRSQGYATYANLLSLFDVYLTDSPDVVGYMIPGKAKIVLNANLTIEQISAVVRHEILHEYLTHMERNKKFHELNGQYIPINELSNIAADFEISNKGYTEADKREMKRLKLNGEILKGLVTELDRPGWENLTYEEMYKRLLDENDATKDKLEELLDRISKLNKQDLDDLEDQLSDFEDDCKSDDSGKSNQSKSNSSDEDKNGSEEPAESGSGNEGDDDQKDAESSNSSNKESENENSSDKAAQIKKQLRDKAGELQDELEKAKEKAYTPSQGGTFAKPEDQRDKVDVAARVSAIEKAFKDLKKKAAMLDEVATNKQKEVAARAARDIAKFQGSGLSKFKMALNRFIQNEIDIEREETYRKLDPRYEDSDFLMPGYMDKESTKIPSINVYWDASGSFLDPAKTAAAKKAIETLNKYERSGQLKMNVWYHGIKIASTYKEAGLGNTPNIVEEHVLQTRPDNVIVITDGDLSYDSLEAEVPGAVWMLFYDTRSKGLMDSLHGKRETKYFDIEYR